MGCEIGRIFFHRLIGKKNFDFLNYMIYEPYSEVMDGDKGYR